MIRLRPVDEADSRQILTWRNDPAISAYMYTDHEITLAEHEAWFERLLTSDDRVGWIVEMDGTPVGAAYITGIDRHHRNAMWAFYLADPSVRGRGVGAVVEASVLEYAFETLRLHKLSCEVLGFNKSVVAMHKKFGFHDEGVFVEEKLKNDRWDDVHRLAFFEQDWLERRDELRTLATGQRR